MLTKRQTQVLDFVKKYTQKKGYSPSLDEIAGKFGFSSLSTVHYHLTQLQEKGLITRQDSIPRSIQIGEAAEQTSEIPLLGLIAAGQPIEAIEQNDTITVPNSMLSRSGEHYALKVKGDSMIDEGIFDNDIVVIRKQDLAENGEIIVALINGNEATLKKIYKEKNGFRLQPANPKLKPIYTRELLVQGKVVSILRNLENQIVSKPLKENEYIFSDEYVSEEQVKELAARLTDFREKNLSKYALDVKDKVFREEILDSAILQNVFSHIVRQHEASDSSEVVKEILKELIDLAILGIEVDQIMGELLKILIQDDTDQSDKSYLVAMLVTLGKPAVNSLGKLLENETSPYWSYAFYSLYLISRKHYIAPKPLLRTLKSSNEKTRMAVMMTFMATGNPLFLPNLLVEIPHASNEWRNFFVQMLPRYLLKSIKAIIEYPKYLREQRNHKKAIAKLQNVIEHSTSQMQDKN